MTYKEYTRAQYEGLGLYGPWTPPFALENRAARDLGGTGCYYAKRRSPILGICLHITAGINDYDGNDGSAAATTKYGQVATAASWTGIVDSDGIINSLHPDRVGWVQGVSGYNFNTPLVGLEIGKLTTDWNDAPDWWVEETLRNAAAYLAPYVIRYKIPIELVTDRDEVQRRINRGQPVGITYHWRLTPDTRTDPGLSRGRETFPFGRFASYLLQAVNKLGGSASGGDTWPVGWIASIQKMYNEIGFTDQNGDPLEVDDRLGPATTYVTENYQRMFELDVDGRPGQQTYKSLEDTMNKLEEMDQISFSPSSWKEITGETVDTNQTRDLDWTLGLTMRRVYNILRESRSQTKVLAAQNKILEQLAANQGIDPETVTQAVTKAVADSMDVLTDVLSDSLAAEGIADAVADAVVNRFSERLAQENTAE